MRTVFLLLVLANLAFFAYGQFARESAARASFSRLEVSPEKIRVLGTSGGAERPQAGAPAARTASAAPGACIEWGRFTGPAVALADTAFARLELPQERVERTVTDAAGYWVYVPALKTKAETDRKVGELKALGVSDFFVVQEPGPSQNAISLGLFGTEEAAQSHLGRLKERGVRSAVAERRDNALRQTAFLVREPDQALVARLAALQRDFPGSELKATPCPGAGAKGQPVAGAS